MRTITFADFEKVKIKIGTIVEASKIEKSTKLLKLLVDFGEDTKTQIISGIGEYYDPESLLKKQIPVIVNLEPRELMGEVSHGMILAVESVGRPVLLSPDVSVENGSEVI
ncbi:methionine--tRNA ligase subunit beta [candidate division WWE3 bacterium CG10_big_fil_rev_8_21_14_0_10_32_10]|uniref:Methionine--tRNA ligase n=1 Tax=candidate division WWE3 bacterium CG10_big_fil_rev_8_21_14_0_10_32_10 TaxID=1975090 RepID=A0A2H0R9U1_UNCKA|nr:MAG: methionine--tRNA ligase subunit beta [candidate division WWE3 bacterium CG10_big_fil_rev_8_21_14_0_10_32_10]